MHFIHHHRNNALHQYRSLSGTGGRRHQKAPVSELNHFFLFFRPFNTHRKICGAAEQILKGDIDIRPYQMESKTGCDHCPYHSVCGFDPKVEGYTFRKNKKLSNGCTSSITIEIMRCTSTAVFPEPAAADTRRLRFLS